MATLHLDLQELLELRKLLDTSDDPNLERVRRHIDGTIFHEEDLLAFRRGGRKTSVHPVRVDL